MSSSRIYTLQDVIGALVGFGTDMSTSNQPPTMLLTASGGIVEVTCGIVDSVAGVLEGPAAGSWGSNSYNATEYGGGQSSPLTSIGDDTLLWDAGEWDVGVWE